MKTISFFKKALFTTAILATGLFIASCTKDNDDDDNSNTFTLSGNASGAQEVPPVTTNGTGTLTGTYDANTNILNYTINWSGISGAASVAHFHGPAAVGVDANPLVDITITMNGVSGTASGNVLLSETAEAYLLAGNIYYNIHTVAHPGGEIRGQVTATAN